MTSKLLFIRGKPSAGKSALSKKLGTTFDLTRVDPDTVKINAKDMSTERVKIIKYRRNLEQAIEALNNGLNVVWTQPWRKYENISLTKNRISNHVDKYECIVIELEISNEVSWERSKHKFANNKLLFETYLSKYQRGGPEVIQIDGCKEISEIVLEIGKLIFGDYNHTT